MQAQRPGEHIGSVVRGFLHQSKAGGGGGAAAVGGEGRVKGHSEKNIGTTAENIHDPPGPTNQPKLFVLEQKQKFGVYMLEQPNWLLDPTHLAHCDCRQLQSPSHWTHRQFNRISQATSCVSSIALYISQLHTSRHGMSRK